MEKPQILILILKIPSEKLKAYIVSTYDDDEWKYRDIHYIINKFHTFSLQVRLTLSRYDENVNYWNVIN